MDSSAGVDLLHAVMALSHIGDPKFEALPVPLLSGGQQLPQ